MEKAKLVEKAKKDEAMEAKEEMVETEHGHLRRAERLLRHGAECAEQWSPPRSHGLIG